MSKNKRIQRTKIFGKKSTQPVNSAMRDKHMTHIHDWIDKFIGVPNRVTEGKLNSAGVHVKKPDWGTGYLEYEPNPDAALHEIAHLILLPLGMGLTEGQRYLDDSFGYVASRYGYMKQKKSLFEIIPMGMEQKLRRLMGMPACTHNVKPDNSPRLCVETGQRYTVIVKNKELLRLSSNLDKGCLNRLDDFITGKIKFNVDKGWQKVA